MSTSGENRLSVFYLANQLQPEHWTWAASDSAAAALLAVTPGEDDITQRQAAHALTEHLVELLEAEGVAVEEVHAIIHDCDEVPVWDELAQAEVLVPKAIHMHAAFKLAGGRQGGMTLPNIAAALGVAPQQIEKPKKGGAPVDGRTGSHDNQLAYLVHIKYTEKHQYAPERVATVRGEAYADIFAKRRPTWIKGRAVVAKKRAAEDLEVLRERVLSGEVTKSQILLTDELFATYSRHQREIDDALSAYGQRRAYKAAAKLRAGDFRTSVFFIHGAAGSGKTHFATELIAEAIERARTPGERWEVYRAATNNPLDDWTGEEVILLDDLRAAAMTATDWLLLLDPENASPAAARYRNKGNVAPRMIVLTASIDPVEYFFYARQRGDVDEALDQFIRRLSSIVKVIREDDLRRYLVSEVRETTPHARIIRTRTGNEVVDLTRAPGPAVSHSAAGASGALLRVLDARCPDLPLGRSDDWLALEALVDQERADHAALAARRALELPPPPVEQPQYTGPMH